MKISSKLMNFSKEKYTKIFFNYLLLFVSEQFLWRGKTRHVFPHDNGRGRLISRGSLGPIPEGWWGWKVNVPLYR